MRNLIIATVLAGVTATPVGAQGSASLDAVTACRAIAANDARLQCFDKAAAALEAAKQKDGLVVLDRTEIRAKKRSLFGLKLPDINLFGSGKDSDDEPAKTRVEEIETTVTSIQSAGRGRWQMRFADGSIWRTTEPAKIDPEKGDKVKVKRAALGSFRASFDGNYPVRVERVE